MVKVAIIGGGLAGTSCAFALKRAGAEPVIYEAAKTLADGASGNDLGTYNPRFTAERTPVSDYFTSAFSFALQTFKNLEDIDWDPCGALHLITDEKKEKRYPQTLINWGWDMDHMHMVDAGEASDIANIDIEHDALFLPNAGYVSPKKLCEAYAKGVDIKFGEVIEDLSDLSEDIIIIANSVSATTFSESEFLPIKPVRGQITQINETHASKHLSCNIHYGGYVGKALNGVHMLGATFQPWLGHTKVLLEDNAANIDKLGEFVPALKGKYEVVGNRASLRAASSDHFPIAGQLPGHDNIYVTTAHGSHGIISTLISAELLTDIILDRPRCLPIEVMNTLSPARFV